MTTTAIEYNVSQWLPTSLDAHWKDPRRHGKQIFFILCEYLTGSLVEQMPIRPSALGHNSRNYRTSEARQAIRRSWHAQTATLGVILLTCNASHRDGVVRNNLMTRMNQCRKRRESSLHEFKRKVQKKRYTTEKANDLLVAGCIPNSILISEGILKSHATMRVMVTDCDGNTRWRSAMGNLSKSPSFPVLIIHTHADGF
jgi:hypothetical protein